MGALGGRFYTVTRRPPPDSANPRRSRFLQRRTRPGGTTMPEKKTLERARRDRRRGKAPSTQAGEFVREEIEHVREGKHGARSTKQAIAIGLSKARRAGVKLAAPAKGTTSRRTRTQAERDLERGSAEKRRRRPYSAARARGARKALEKEGRSAASHSRAVAPGDVPRRASGRRPSARRRRRRPRARARRRAGSERREPARQPRRGFMRQRMREEDHEEQGHQDQRRHHDLRRSGAALDDAAATGSGTSAAGRTRRPRAPRAASARRAASSRTARTTA